MGVAEDNIDLEEQINLAKNGPMITMNSEINFCPRKPRHDMITFTIQIKIQKKKKIDKIMYRNAAWKMSVCPLLRL